MSDSTGVASGSSAVRRVENRDVERTAPLRCLAYAAYSELLASPHDIDPRPRCDERLGVGAAVGWAPHLDDLLAEFRDTELAALRTAYSGLFEVGNQGPPAPIREDLQTGQRGGTREEIVRFYEHFGYVLDERFAWQPDHLSVELEFIHYLCYLESRQDEQMLSCQLAQFDFTERHPGRWVPAFTEQVERLAAGSIYSRVLASLDEFLGSDLAWQAGTIR